MRNLVLGFGASINQRLVPAQVGGCGARALPGTADLGQGLAHSLPPVLRQGTWPHLAQARKQQYSKKAKNSVFVQHSKFIL